MGYIRGDEWDWKLFVNWVGPYTVVLDREDLATHLYVSNLWLKYEASNASIYINLFQPSIVIGGGPLSFVFALSTFFSSILKLSKPAVDGCCQVCLSLVELRNERSGLLV